MLYLLQKSLRYISLQKRSYFTVRLMENTQKRIYTKKTHSKGKIFLSTPKRYLLLILAVIVQSAGIALVVKSLLGTSPISSLPYVLSLISPFTFGQTTFAVNMIFVAFELLMLRRDFPAIFWLQIPVTILFGFCIDFFMQLFTIVPAAYVLRLLLCLLGTSLVALGVAGQGIADVLMLAGEGAVYVFSRKARIDFGKVKVGNDLSLVVLAAIVSMLTMSTIEGIREGTLISALLTGIIARFFLHHLSRIDDHGRLYLSPHKS